MRSRSVRYDCGAARTLESLDDEGRCGRNDVDLGLSVLDGELDRYAETLPRRGSLGDIFTDLLR